MLFAEGNPETRALSLWTRGFSWMSARVNYSCAVGMTQIIIVDLDGTLSDPVRKLEC